LRNSREDSMSLPVSAVRVNTKTTVPEPEPPEPAPDPLEEPPEVGAGAGAGTVPEKGNGSTSPRVVRAVVASVAKRSRIEESSLAEKSGSAPI
jgi:hypothetical protein